MFESQYVQNRIEKGRRLVELGGNPFGSIGSRKQTISIEKFRELYSTVDLNVEDKSSLEIETLFGRVMLLRKMGKSAFITIESDTHRIQAFLNVNSLGAKYEILKKALDLGDIVSVSGYAFLTKTEELSIHAKDFDILTKSIKPLPEKFHGLEDKELRYRKRELDMITNSNVLNTFKVRSKIISSIRETLVQKDYFEVETPTLNPIPGGANAKPFVTYHNALSVDRYLRIAPELYLKRLIVGGMESVFEIGKCYRNEGVDQTHNPEFTSVEFYKSYISYLDLMVLIEDMVSKAWKSLSNDSSVIEYGDMSININNWQKISFESSLIEIGGVPAEILQNEVLIYDYLKEKGFSVKENLHLGKLWEELFDNFVEEKLIDPTFITDYPTSISPLARRQDNNPDFTERFELFIAGREIANGFNELNDPMDQYERFLAQVNQKDSDDESMHMDKDFVEALMYAMPPTAGAGLGIDRLVMLFTNSASIKDVILFPAMK